MFEYYFIIETVTVEEWFVRRKEPSMLKILTVFGTRPEAIKMAPVIKAMAQHPGKLVCPVCVTGQHREMLDPFLKLFAIKPAYDLELMQKNQTLESLTSLMMARLGEVMDKEKPDYLMVQGDTTSAMVGSLLAFYRKVKVAHVEAGLRTGNKWQPYPEEINRKIIDLVGDLYFAHSESAKQNLLREGVEASKIEVTGNTVVDALLDVARRDFDPRGTALEGVPLDARKIILVTIHRRESFGGPLEDIFKAIRIIAERYPSEVRIVFPVHLNPNVRQSVYKVLEGIPNVSLIEPLNYFEFVHLMKKAYLILTDSGGVQEESPSLDKPVLVLREVTERPEAVESGAVKIAGTQTDRIVAETVRLLEDKKEYQRMADAKNPYGDGTAGLKIVRRFLREAESHHV